jgi:hypothetical protein
MTIKILLLKYKILTPHGINKNATRNKKFPELREKILAAVPWACSVKEALFCISREIMLQPVCKECMCSFVKFEERGSGSYKATCGTKCLNLRFIKRNIEQAEETQKSRLKFKIIGADGLSGYQRFAIKSSMTRINHGLQIAPADLQEFKKYRRACYRQTKSHPIHLLLNYEKRGRCGTAGAYQIDHKLSIIEGFKQKVCPSIIGHICNLECLPWKENRTKGRNSSITLSELMLKILNHQLLDQHPQLL